jgi:multiple sugar transport system substrate-binding protein
MFHLSRRAALALSVAVLAAGAASAQERVLRFNANFDPAPLAGWEALIADFEAANPDIDVQLNNFDHEGYKTAIRNFLSADPPDLFTWFAGNRMAPFVGAGQVMDVSDVWAGNGLSDTLASAKASMTIDDKQWGVPYTYYQWGIYYNVAAYEAAGVALPGDDGVTWEEFLANCATFQAADIDCITTGTSALWPAAGIFDYLSLRTNGYDWHMQLTNGEIPWTDDSVRAVFAEFAKIQPFVTANHAAIDWQDAAAIFARGEAAHYVMGNFAVAVFKEGGMTNETLGFMSFPAITAGIPRGEEAPTDTIHIAANAPNAEDAKAFLAFVAQADVQTKLNAAIGQLPVNNQSSVSDDPFLQEGFTMLSTADGGIAQFFDRDAPAEMAKIAMEGFQQFMVQPDQLDAILERLEQARQRIYN